MTSREVALAPVTTANALGRWLADRIIPVIHSFRGRHLFVIDLALIVLSIYLALVLRGIDPVGAALATSYGPLLLLPVVVRPIVNDRFGLCRRLWSHASVPELTQIVLRDLARQRDLDRPRRGPVPGARPGDDGARAVLLDPRVHVLPRPARRDAVPAPRPQRGRDAGRRRRHDDQPDPGAPLRRRPGRRDDGPLRDPRAGRRRQAGRLPRQRPRQARQHRRRPAGVRRPRPARRGDPPERCADAPDHAAEPVGPDDPPDHGRRDRGRPPGPDGPAGPRPVRRQLERPSRPRHPGRGPPDPRAGHDARPAGRRVDPRPGGDGHRRRRIDRVRAGPPGLCVPPEEARPRRPGREPALHDPARAGAPPDGRSRRRRAVGQHRERREPGRHEAPDRIDPARGHLPRGRVQARADDGGAPLRGRPGQRRRDDGRPVGRRRGGRPAVRPRLDRQGRRAVVRHGRHQAPRGVARRRRRPDDRPQLRRGPVRERPRARPAASCRSSRASSSTARRSRSPIPR